MAFGLGGYRLLVVEQQYLVEQRVSCYAFAWEPHLFVLILLGDQLGLIVLRLVPDQ